MVSKLTFTLSTILPKLGLLLFSSVFSLVFFPNKSFGTNLRFYYLLLRFFFPNISFGNVKFMFKKKKKPQSVCWPNELIFFFFFFLKPKSDTGRNLYFAKITPQNLT